MSRPLKGGYMRQVSHFRCFPGLRLEVFVLAVALSASSAFAQRAGHWTGTNSFGFPMDFDVSTAGVITGYYTGFFQHTCPSGAQPFTSLRVGGATPIVEGSFRDELPLSDGASFSSVFSGAFTSDTEANGNFTELSARFRVQGKDVDTQSCQSDSTWIASWESAGAARERSTSADGNQRYVQVTSEWQRTTLP